MSDRRAAPVSRLGALAAAVRSVTEAASQDPSAVLEELARQAEALLGCDGASIHLAEPGGSEDRVVFRRVRISEFGRARGVEATPLWEADDSSLASLRAGRSVFHENFLAVVDHQVAERPWLREIASAMYAPLVIADEPLGVLFAAWTRPRRADAELLLAGDGLASCAAVAVHQARLLERWTRAHAELEAVFDAVEDSILIFDERGGLARANRRARERMLQRFGRVPRSVEEIERLAGPVRLGTASKLGLVNAGLAGEASDAVFEYRSGDGRTQRLHADAAPIWRHDGSVGGVVVVGRNITQLHNAIAEGARLDGAIKTARMVAHQLNNQLSPVRGYSELLVDMLEGEPRQFAQRISRAVEVSSATVARLQRIIKFEETDAGGYPMLDLDAAAPPPE